MREPRLSAENAKLRDELARLKKGPDPDVLTAPATAGREIPATQTKKKMTLASATEHAAKLRAAGQYDAAMRFLGAAEIEG